MGSSASLEEIKDTEGCERDVKEFAFSIASETVISGMKLLATAIWAFLQHPAAFLF